MEPSIEIRRLFDIMPDAARMNIDILSQPEQPKVLDSSFPLPWNRERLIYINFDLWCHLSKPQRDLLLLQMVCWLREIKWFVFDIDVGVVAIAVFGGLVELAQGDVVGVAVAGGLTALAIARIWHTNQALDSQLNADIAAIAVAQRRGLLEAQTAEHLLNAIVSVSKIEGRSALNFTELVRCQNLRVIAGLSSVGIKS